MYTLGLILMLWWLLVIVGLVICFGVALAVMVMAAVMIDHNGDALNRHSMPK